MMDGIAHLFPRTLEQENDAAERRKRRLASNARPIEDKPAEAFQEVHSPTEGVMVKIDGTRTRQLARRRKADARLFDRLDGDQERAMQWIVTAYRDAAGAVMVRTQSFDRQRGASTDDREAFLADCRRAYRQWTRQCVCRGILVEAVTGILCDGESARAMDGFHRKRHGWAAGNMIAGLDLFAALQGWKSWRAVGSSVLDRAGTT